MENEKKRIAIDMLLDKYTYDEIYKIAESPEETEDVAMTLSADYQAWYNSPLYKDDTYPEDIPESVIIKAIHELTAE